MSLTSDIPKTIRPLYLDAQATTPMDPRVVDAMLPYMTSKESFSSLYSSCHILVRLPRDIVFTDLLC